MSLSAALRTSASRKGVVYFSHKDKRIWVGGSKGGIWTERESHEFDKSEQATKRARTCADSFKTVPADDDLLVQGQCIAVLESGFDPSVHSAIQKAVLSQSPFDDGTIRTVYAKDGSSQSCLAGSVVYRRQAISGLVVYEVLFLAVHPTNKKRGAGQAIVECLKRWLSAEDAEGQKVLCVSLKSESSEAAKFWGAAGMLPSSESGEDAAVENMMIRFDDFAPFMMRI